MPKNNDFYLLGFTETELTELYEALVLKDELKRRFYDLRTEKGDGESKLLYKIARQFSDRTQNNLKDHIVDELDDYVDRQVDDEIMWHGIEEQLRKKMDE